jgi:hypothetical protein
MENAHRSLKMILGPLDPTHLSIWRAARYRAKQHGAMCDERLSVACHPDRIPWKYFKISSIVTAGSSLSNLSTGYDALDELQTRPRGHHPIVLEKGRQNHSTNFYVNGNCYLARHQPFLSIRHWHLLGQL